MDGARQRIDDGLDPNRLRKFLGNERQRRPRRLADAECQVSGLAPIAITKYPPRRRLRVNHEVLHDIDAEVSRRLVPKVST